MQLLWAVGGMQLCRPTACKTCMGRADYSGHTCVRRNTSTIFKIPISPASLDRLNSKTVPREIRRKYCSSNGIRSVKTSIALRWASTIRRRVATKSMLPVRWMAPESLVMGVFTPASDIWSFGVLLYEIITFGNFPFQGLSNSEVLEYVKKGNTLTIPTGIDQDLSDEKILYDCPAKNTVIATERRPYVGRPIGSAPAIFEQPVAGQREQHDRRRRSSAPLHCSQKKQCRRCGTTWAPKCNAPSPESRGTSVPDFACGPQSQRWECDPKVAIHYPLTNFTALIAKIIRRVRAARMERSVSVLDRKARRVLNFPLTVSQQLWLSFLMPSIVETTFYVVDIATDLAIAVEFLARGPSPMAGLITLLITYIAPLAVYITQLINPPPENEFKAFAVWFLVETVAFLLYPLRPVQW
ncbi:unnamed protein product [Nesidiocoris tenuis]|uniref:Protein kinase domain-containing protein n=1 Tax=Nesidiocoris tenuis TaxID=355587 RepID=A0A6H5GX79_9HEMI|nr:unnamed protein product [Nesidiocoris tenuis]